MDRQRNNTLSRHHHPFRHRLVLISFLQLFVFVLIFANRAGTTNGQFNPELDNVNKISFGLIQHKLSVSLCNQQQTKATTLLACPANEELSIISVEDQMVALLSGAGPPPLKHTIHYRSQSSLKDLCTLRYERTLPNQTLPSTTRVSHIGPELYNSKFISTCVDLIIVKARFASKLGELCNRRQSCNPSDAIETRVDCSPFQIERKLNLAAEITYVCMPNEFSTSTIEYRDISKTITCLSDSLIYVRRCSLKVSHNDRQEQVGAQSDHVQLASKFWFPDENKSTELLDDIDDFLSISTTTTTTSPERARRAPKVANCKALQFVSIIVAENCHGQSHCSIRLTKVIDQSVKYNLCDIKNGLHPLMQSSAEIEYTCIDKLKLNQTDREYFEYAPEGNTTETTNSEAKQSNVKLIHEFGYFTIDSPLDQSASGAVSQHDSSGSQLWLAVLVTVLPIIVTGQYVPELMQAM